ncbi:MAG: CstA-like transporter-associated (seleno)protein [Methylophilaceae bacterium]
MFKTLRHIWHMVRRLTGDDAYDRYLRHHAIFHEASVDAPPPLSRKAFFKLWQDDKWKGINRCC